MRRTAGILLHPTSLPGASFTGELGPEAVEFVRFLAEAGQGTWQLLPLGPMGGDGSPYASPSAFAGNPLLVSTRRLVSDGLLVEDELPGCSSSPVDYSTAVPAKNGLLRRAFERFSPGESFRRFRERSSYWLEDYVMFVSLSERYGWEAWNRWPAGLARREPQAMWEAGEELAGELQFHRFVQYLFDEHYGRVRREARGVGVEILGDMPIFVSHNSADVWANQHLFKLDEEGEPVAVAGVPPDYFSQTGQRWGNPLYDWEAMAGEGYGWWVRRMRRALELYDAVRIDHFRGFAACWEIPASDEDATGGRWETTPGYELFRSLTEEFGELPLVAEDLGLITEDVERLRDSLGFPGMKVLQFAFSGPENPYLPHNYRGGRWIAYTGTHDNDTTEGWLSGISTSERRFLSEYLGREYVSAWDIMRLALASVAHRVVVPMQDALGLGSQARMNTPGTTEGNWRWRMDEGAADAKLAGSLRRLAYLYNRL